MTMRLVGGARGKGVGLVGTETSLGSGGESSTHDGRRRRSRSRGRRSSSSVAAASRFPTPAIHTTAGLIVHWVNGQPRHPAPPQEGDAKKRMAAAAAQRRTKAKLVPSCGLTSRRVASRPIRKKWPDGRLAIAHKNERRYIPIFLLRTGRPGVRTY